MKYLILLVMLFSTSAYADNLEYRTVLSVVGTSNKIDSCFGDCLLDIGNTDAPISIAISVTHNLFDIANIGIEGSISDNPSVLFLLNKRFGNFSFEINAGFVERYNSYSFSDLTGKYFFYPTSLSKISGATVTYKNLLVRYLITSNNDTINYNEATSVTIVSGSPVYSYTNRTNNIKSTKTIWWVGYFYAF